MLFGFEDPVAAEGEPAETDIDAIDPPVASKDGADSKRSWWFAVAGLVVGALLASLAFLLWPSGASELTQIDIESAVNDALEDRAAGPTAAATAFEQIAPSLVGVRASSADDDAPANIGAGVVINEQGQILTSNHVIDGAIKVELLFADGSVVTAAVDSTDPDLDIAVVRALGPSSPLVPAVLGNARTLQIGDAIFAVGNPLGLTGSISAGVVSGLNRDIPFPGDAPGDDSERVLADLIQFDAAVNQGSSGGPLLNADGQVVGIVTALADPAGQGFFIGIGFAVPIDIAAQRAADGPSQ